jgi:hypothetical protein
VTRRGIAALTVVCVLTLPAISARADAPIKSFSVSTTSTQAGGHPDITTTFELGARDNQSIKPPSCDCQDAKDITMNFPAGLIGNPHALPACTSAELAAVACPPDSQIGVTDVEAGIGFSMVPVYNLEPHPGEAGLIGFNYPSVNFPVYFALSPRTESDYGLTATSTGLTHVFPLESARLTLWGVPASSIHDRQRFPLGFANCYDFEHPPYECENEHEAVSTPGLPSNAPEEPFLQNPTTCGVPASVSMEVVSYDGGTSSVESPWPATTGCDQLSFNPSLFAQPTGTETDSPSGLEVDLQVPQQESPSVPSPSEIRAATVTLPVGFSINPNAADGKLACGDLEARLGTRDEAQCPQFSKIGSLTIRSSALPGPLPGFVYLGAPLPGERYRILLVANGFSVHVKLTGSVRPSPVNGQLVVSFNDLPQSPLSEFNMHFFGSERGLLATPDHCGTYPVDSTFTPWDSALKEQSSTQYFTLDSGPNGTPCPPPARPFHPGFQAASVNSAAGSHAPFSLELMRSDGDQNLAALTVSTPPGLLAALSGIPYCSEAALATAADASYPGLAEQASSVCPLASQIGTTTTAAGAGTHPVYLPGKVYLAGPYKGAPLSLAVITPAISGPYDLGNVVVRAALRVDPWTAQVTAVSDPLPQIFVGIPLRLREIRVNLDREDFALNPTNCDPFSVDARVTGDQEAAVDLAEPFQVANCASLPFGPKLSMRLSGATRRTGNPALTTVLTAKAGEANVSSATVTLPPTEQIDNAHINSPCTRVQFAADSCPPGSVIGSAKAETPLLGKPLEGPVYLMTGFGHKLPDVVAALRGQIDIDLDGHVYTVHRAIRTTFSSAPDAPISKFTLSLDGGRKGLLENNTDLCRASLVAVAAITGQNGASVEQSPALQAPCGEAARHRRHRGHGRAVGRR